MKIKISNLSKSFYQNKTKLQILKNINVEINEGEIVALLGKSGSGKSTLLALMAGLDRPDSGSIEIDDNHIEKMNDTQLTDWRAQNIGIVFQQFHLVSHLTALENVCLSLEVKYNNNIKVNMEKASAWLKSVGLEKREKNFPSMLSGGEQQRVAIARALAHNPRLVLADEPSGNLDIETGKAVMNKLFEIIRLNKMTLILVTHDEELAKRADRIINLENGECINAP